MAARTSYIFITSNRQGETIRVKVTSSFVKGMLFFGSIFFVLFFAISWDYLGLLSREDNFIKTKTDNVQLKEELVVIESQLNTLKENLDKVKNVSKKVELISNASDDAVLNKLAAVNPLTFEAGRRLKGALNSEKAQPEFLMKLTPFISEAPIASPMALEEFEMIPLAERIEDAASETLLTEQKVLQLWETLSERQNFIRSTPSIKPANGWFSSRFGYRIDPFTRRPTMHAGLDIAARIGTPIFAAADGVVEVAGRRSGYGNLVVVDHGYGVKTRYAHASKVYVKSGQKVKRYEMIAAVGNTGRSTSAHLHYEVRVRGVPVDPMNYVLDFE